MNYNDFLNLLEEYGKIRKCIHCEGYQGALMRLRNASNFLEHSEEGLILPEEDIYGFLSCEICPPLEILEEYLKMEGKGKISRPRKKKFSLDDFSVKLFLRKISGDLK